MKGALQLGVLKTADSVALRVGGRNGLDMEIKEEVVNQVAAFVWDTVSENWADDLTRFTVHAGRQKINMEDMSLLTRRNPELFQAACKLAGVDNHQDGAVQKSGKGRKRKKEDVVSVQPPKPPKPEEDDITVLDDEKTLHTPKSYLKKPKHHEEISRGRLTSTPKIAERTLNFPDDITPIRPTDNEVFSSNVVNLSAIEEEKTNLEGKQNEEDEQDSFDVFGSTKGNESTKTITNMSTLVKRAEEYSSVVESTIDRLENERLERMIPTEEEEEEVDHVSVDSFDNYNVQDPPIDKSAGTPKNAVFNNKMSSFAFDDDDSFDEPMIPQVPKTTPKNTSTSAKKKGIHVETTPKYSTATKKNKSLQLDHDSFDEFDFDI